MNMAKTLRTAVIGVGYLGKFHADKYALLPHSELIAVVDTDMALCSTIANQLSVQALTDYRELLGQVDAVSIAVPTQKHYEIAKTCLENNIHVLLEKPITVTVEEAQTLITLAKQNKCVLQVGHLERFNAAIVTLINEGILSKPQFIESNRIAPFKLRGVDVNVVLDLMIHDIDIIQTLVNSPIKNVVASGSPVLSKEIDIANARIQFENGAVANVTASRVSLKSERTMRIFQPDSYITVDFQKTALKIYRKGTAEMFPGIPEILSEERIFQDNDPIRDEISAFINAISTRTPPIVSGEEGKRALETAIDISHLITQQKA
jgi:predicted dehydrogenase